MLNKLGEVAKDESPVAPVVHMRDDYRPASRETELVLTLKGRVLGKEASGVHDVVAKIFVRIAMELIGSRLGDERHERAASQSVFGGNAIYNPELADVLYGRRPLCDSAHRRVVFRRDAINNDLAVHPDTAHDVVLETRV